MYVKIGNKKIELPKSFGIDKDDVEIKIKSIDDVPYPRTFGDRCQQCGRYVRWVRRKELINLMCERCGIIYRIFDLEER